MAPLKRFAAGILAGIGSVLVGLAAAFGLLAVAWPSNLPAPALSPMVHMDEKLRFLRNRPELEPRIIAVGSSITWRQVAGAQFVPLAGGPKHFVNGATAHLQINQTRALTDFYLDNYPEVRTVLFMTSLPDFVDCSEKSDQMLDRQDARAYAFEGWPAVYFYLRYFSPRRYVRTALTLPERRTPFTGDLYLDDYGSGPVKLPDSVDLGLRYQEIRPDHACVEALSKMLNGLSDRGVRTVLVFAPVHPEYRRTYPDTMARLEEIVDSVKTPPPGTLVLVLYDDSGFDAEDFYDAFHLEFPAVKRLSSLIARAMEHRGATQVLTGEMIRCLGESAGCRDVYATEPTGPRTLMPAILRTR